MRSQKASSAVWLLVGGILLGALGECAAGPAWDLERGELGSGSLWPESAVEDILDDLARAAVGEKVNLPTSQEEYLEPGEEGYKSPGRAFFMSLLLPGAGELYTGSMRGLAFLGVEMLSWGGYLYYDNKGKDERSGYESFADLHYSRVRYERVIDEICGKYLSEPNSPCGACDTCGGNWCEYRYCQADSFNSGLCNAVRDHFLLPYESGQHYYEDLGKYDKYVFGWDDWYGTYNPSLCSWRSWKPGDPWPNYPYADGLAPLRMQSANRETYRDMRRRSNDYLDRATYFTWFVVINHVASALDAALAARDHNRRLAGERPGVDVGMETRPLSDDLETLIYVRKRF